MVLDAALAAAGDEDHLGDSGRRRFLDRVLDQRLVDDRQHLLRLRLGGRQKSCAEPGHGKYRLSNTVLNHCFRSSCRNASSSITLTPSRSRRASFDPAPRRPPRSGPRRDRAGGMAAVGSDQVLCLLPRQPESVPVTTIVWPATCGAGATASLPPLRRALAGPGGAAGGRTPAPISAAIASRLCASAKNLTRLATISGPTPSSGTGSSGSPRCAACIVLLDRSFAASSSSHAACTSASSVPNRAARIRPPLRRHGGYRARTATARAVARASRRSPRPAWRADFSPIRSNAASCRASGGRCPPACAPARLDQLIDQLVSQAVDVHGPALREMHQRLLALCRADQAADAAPGRFAFGAFDGRVAGRAGVGIRNSPRVARAAAPPPGPRPRESRRPRAARPRCRRSSGPCGAISSSLCSVALLDRDAADEHRLEPRDRRQRRRCAPPGSRSRASSRAGFLGRELVGDRVARRPRHEADPRLASRAGRPYRRRRRSRTAACCAARRLRVVVEQRLDAVQSPDQGATGNPKAASHSISPVIVAGTGASPDDFADAVGEERQRSRGGDA